MQVQTELLAVAPAWLPDGVEQDGPDLRASHAARAPVRRGSSARRRSQCVGLGLASHARMVVDVSAATVIGFLFLHSFN